MKFFKKYIFPALYGLLTYFTIRLLHDIDVSEHFWEREWYFNFVEISCSVIIGYVGIYLFRRLFRYYDTQSIQLSYQTVVRELVILVGANLVLVNTIFVPMDSVLHHGWTSWGISWADITDINMIPTLYAIVYYGMVRSSIWLRAYVDNKVQLEKLTNEHLQTELKFLKAQYHPHFLFNAINTVYFQMDEDVQGAKKTLEKFSELLRYQLYDQQLQVPIIQEIAHLNSFIDLQKMRCSSQLKLTVEIDPHLQQQKVYPLLFLPLVENAFKYVGGDYNLTIKLCAHGDLIRVYVNNSVPKIIATNEKSGGIGLENLQRRLELLYPNQYKFSSGKFDNEFIAELEITSN